MRGKQLFTGKLNSNFRITPAGAGKTPPKARFIPLSQDHPRRCGENGGYLPHVQAGAWDHPRRCGENNKRTRSSDSSAGSPPQVRGKPKGLTYSMQASVGGSPPQVRGKHRGIAGFAWELGITPAGAGKTLTVSSIITFRPGSPPQVRGKLVGGSGTGKTTRITPAGAGKTLSSSPAVGICWDHPRRCGENCLTVRWFVL